MSRTIRRFIAGNWKMNGLSPALDQARLINEDLGSHPATCRVALFPPATLLSRLAQTLDGGAVDLGAQDCHASPSGAFTGDISAEMIADAGGRLVILGHSERRAYHHESDADVAAKAVAARRAGLEPVICVGETWEERSKGRALEIVASQLELSLPDVLQEAPFSVAYEPIWAIGTGHVPTPEDVAAMHGAIRTHLKARFGAATATPILYGGSANAKNAAALLDIEGVDGLLVGGASLAADSFLAIIRAAG